MTKADQKAVAVGAGIGVAAFLVFWFGIRKTIKIPELNPAMVKFEGA